MKRLHLVAWLALPLVAAIAGCGGSGSGAQVRGTIVEKGSTLKLASEDTLIIEAVYKDKEGNAKQTFGRFNNEDGTFSLDGVIPVGAEVKFIVRCQQSSAPSAKDRFRNAFAGARTPLTYAVTAGGRQEIVLDLTEKRVKGG